MPEEWNDAADDPDRPTEQVNGRSPTGLVPPLRVMRRRLNGVYRADGFSGPTRRYVLIVALLVALASIPTLAAITAGTDSIDDGPGQALDVPILTPPSAGPVVRPRPGSPGHTPSAQGKEQPAPTGPSSAGPSAAAKPAAGRDQPPAIHGGRPTGVARPPGRRPAGASHEAGRDESGDDPSPGYGSGGGRDEKPRPPTGKPRPAEPRPTKPSRPADPADPADPAEPSVPDDPEGPDVPEDPEPGLPDDPEGPDVPEDPEPGLPDDPEGPGLPEDPEPSAPDDPEAPAEPADPQQPPPPDSRPDHRPWCHDRRRWADPDERPADDAHWSRTQDPTHDSWRSRVAERSPNRRHLRDTPASDDHVRAASGARASQSPAAQTRTAQAQPAQAQPAQAQPAQAQAAQARTADGRTRRSAGPGHRRQSEAGGWTYQGSHRSTPGHRFVAGRHAADAPRPGRQYAD